MLLQHSDCRATAYRLDVILKPSGPQRDSGNLDCLPAPLRLKHRHLPRIRDPLAPPARRSDDSNHCQSDQRGAWYEDALRVRAEIRWRDQVSVRRIDREIIRHDAFDDLVVLELESYP